LVSNTQNKSTVSTPAKVNNSSVSVAKNTSTISAPKQAAVLASQGYVKVVDWLDNNKKGLIAYESKAIWDGINRTVSIHYDAGIFGSSVEVYGPDDYYLIEGRAYIKESRLIEQYENFC
jgi:hypothetical protein